MPIYEYECKQCNIVFEEWLSVPGENEMSCPSCEELSDRIISDTCVAKIRSGFVDPGVIGPEDTELDKNKHDIYGRNWNNLPDNMQKARNFHRWEQNYEERTGRKPEEGRKDVMLRKAMQGERVDKKY